MGKTITYQKPTRVVTSGHGQFTPEQEAELARRTFPDRIPAPAPPPRQPRERKRAAEGPMRPVDMLARWFPPEPERRWTFGGGRDLPTDAAAVEPYMAAGKAPTLPALATVFYPPEPAPRGAAEYRAKLKRLGVELVPTIDGEFAVLAEKGRLTVEVRDAIEAARPLLRAHVHGTDLRCAMPHHSGGLPPVAVTLAEGGAPWCGEWP